MKTQQPKAPASVFGFIRRLFMPAPLPGARNGLYAEVLVQARNLAPERFANPSATTQDRYARFEVIALLMSLVMWQARHDPDAKDRATLAMEAMFDDFDVALREQGVSDIRVGPEVRKLAAAFNGRRQRYFEAFDQPQGTALATALAHNWKISPAAAKTLAKKLKTLGLNI